MKTSTSNPVAQTVRKTYAKEFQEAGLSSLTVAKLLQLEHRFDLVVDLTNNYPNLQLY